jgi:ATP-dependent protease Clp ATPase subunit
VRVELEPLDQDQLYRVLVEPPDAAVREYKALLRLDGIELEFTEGALRTVAAFAYERSTGARALRGFIEELCHEIMFEAPERRGETIVVDEGTAREHLERFGEGVAARDYG